MSTDLTSLLLEHAIETFARESVICRCVSRKRMSWPEYRAHLAAVIEASEWLAEHTPALGAEVQRLRAGIKALIAAPDDTQWWEVVPYMDPPDQDEVVQVQVVAADRLRALLGGGAS